MAYIKSISGTTKGQEKSKTNKLLEAKMVLVGNGEVGKSSVRIKLLDKETPLPKEEERTPGLEISPYHVKVPSSISQLPESVDFQLNIWDFGGQGKYREIQQLFCNPKTLYLFVTAIDDNPEDKEDYVGFEYWLSMVRAYSYDATDEHFAPVIHVVNKVDKGEVAINQKDILNPFGNICKFISISCKTLENFSQLEETIKNTLPTVNNKIFIDEYAVNWLEVKEELVVLQERHHIQLSEYFEICERHGLNEEQGRIWLRILDRIGTVIYFGDNEQLNNWVIVNPVWVKDALCKVMDSPSIRNGIFTTADFPNIWQRPLFDPDEHERLIQLMLAYKLCYAQTNVFDDAEYIVPSLLKDIPPRLPDIVTQNPTLQISLHYTPFIPAGTVNKLMVDLQEHIYNQLRWKNNVIFHDAAKNAYAHVREDWEQKKVSINYFGEDIPSLHYLILSALGAINDQLKRTRYIHHLGFEVAVWHKEKWFSVETLKDFIVTELSFLWTTNSKHIQLPFREEIKSENQTVNMDHIRNLIATGRLEAAFEAAEDSNAVSYTHLTLPTICSV